MKHGIKKTSMQQDLYSNDMNKLTLELAQYKIKDGVDEESLLKASEGIMEDVRKASGFVCRDLVKGTNGLWIDVVYWNSLSEAQDFAKKFMEHPSCLKYIQMIDEFQLVLCC